MSKSLDRLVADNRKRFVRNLHDGLVLADVTYAQPLIVETTLRIAESVCKTLGADLAALHLGARAPNETKLVQSHSPARETSLLARIAAGLLRHPLAVSSAFFHLSNGNSIVRWCPHGMPVGRHIYDSLLIGTARPRIGKLTWTDRVRVLAEISFFFGMLDWIKAIVPRFVILPDNTYRNGMLFELCAHDGIPCIAGIDAGGVAMHVYRNAEDFRHHCRTPDEHVVAAVLDSSAEIAAASELLAKRTMGGVAQHDVVRAYANTKRSTTRDSLNAEYGLDPRLPLVLVMAHVFSDAPHAYPGTLFQDYDEWLRWTTLRLRATGRANVLVKRHPSSSLYGEQTVLDSVLGQIGCGDLLLADDINTRSLFDSVDAIVTCGGTAGMEFPCFGVNVIVAARPPYSGFGYVHCPATIEAYGSLLDGIDKLPPLSAEQRAYARAVMYAIQEKGKVEPEILGFGSQRISPDAPFRTEQFYDEMLGQEEGQRALDLVIAGLVRGDSSNLQRLTFPRARNEIPTV